MRATKKMFQLILQMVLLTMYATYKQLSSKKKTQEEMIRHSQAANDIKINLVSLSFAIAIRTECNSAAVAVAAATNDTSQC